MFKRINNVLNNENGGPNVEQIMGIAVAIAVGVALLSLGRAMSGWMGDAETSISAIGVGEPDSGVGSQAGGGA